MSDLTHLQRSLRILQRLMTHDKVTVNELFDLFDRTVPKRTIQRTLQDIESANIPLHSERGPHGVKYYSLGREFDFVPLVLSTDELFAALLLGQFSQFFTGTRIGESIKRVYERLDQLVPPDRRPISTVLGQVRETFALLDPGRVDLRPVHQHLSEIFHAIISSQVCWIKYRAKKYQVHPYGLLLYEGSFYVVAFQPVHKAFIHLALPRIVEVERTRESFERDPSFSLSNYLRDTFGIWSAEPEPVKIRFKPEVATSIEERVWHSSQRIKKLPDGGIELAMKVGINEELMAWILRWGPYAEALEPESLRDQIKKKLKQTLKSY